MSHLGADFGEDIIQVFDEDIGVVHIPCLIHLRIGFLLELMSEVHQSVQGVLCGSRDHSSLSFGSVMVPPSSPKCLRFLRGV